MGKKHVDARYVASSCRPFLILRDSQERGYQQCRSVSKRFRNMPLKKTVIVDKIATVVVV